MFGKKGNIYGIHTTKFESYMNNSFNENPHAYVKHHDYNMQFHLDDGNCMVYI